MFQYTKRFAEIISASVGSLETMCYLVFNKNKILIIDPGAEPDSISGFIENNFKNPEINIFLTHGHFDHINGVPKLCEKFPNASIFMNELDFELKEKKKYNENPISLINLRSKIKFLVDNDNIKVDDEDFKVIHVPGHTPGSLALYGKDSGAIFVGDTLFQGTIGNSPSLTMFEELKKNIEEKLLILIHKTQVFPGHGQSTTIISEINNNDYVGKNSK